MYYGDDIEIIGTGLNRYQLMGCEGLYNKVFLFDSSLSFMDKVFEIVEIILRFGVDFVHAQPEEEVDFLCLANDTARIISDKIFGKNIEERSFYSDKTAVQGIMGQNVYDLDYAMKNEPFRDDQKLWVRANVGAGSKYAMPVESLGQAFNWARFLIDSDKISSPYELSISPYLPGREFAVQLFYIEGVLIHAQQRERVEHHFAKQMISGQSSTPSVAVTSMEKTVYLEAFEVVSTVSRELGVKPNGIYCVDLRMDDFDNPVVTEVNYGRYFTTSNFFATFGMNTPVAELQYFLKEEIPDNKINSIRPGIYWVRSLDSEPVWYTIEDLEEL
jgi:carbamoyl-phosphate synthase large subunit